jgi:hypothetical protein
MKKGTGVQGTVSSEQSRAKVTLRRPPYNGKCLITHNDTTGSVSNKYGTLRNSGDCPLLTREKYSPETGKKERFDHGRDWYDLIWYISKGVSPNYDFLSNKLNYKGPFENKNINADLIWIKNELFKRMEGIDYNILNRDIASITLKENRIMLTKDLLTEKINLFAQGQNWGGNGGNNNIVFISLPTIGKAYIS